MSSTSFQVLADSASGLNEQECGQSRSVRLNSTSVPCSEGIGQLSPSTTTCELSLPSVSRQTEFQWMPSVVDFRARTFPQSAPALALTASEAAFGVNTSDWFANYDQKSSSWRTSQACLIEGWEEFSETWPASGTMRNGRCFRAADWVPHIHESECSLWHTPTNNEKKPAGQKEMEMVRLHDLGHSVPNTYIRLRSQLAARTGLRLPANPNWLESQMGFPIGFSATEPSEILSRPLSSKQSAAPSSQQKD